MDLTALKNEEPQGIAVYNNDLIISFADGSYYSIKLNLNFKQTGYAIPCAADEDVLKEAIAKAVEAELEKDVKTKGFTVEKVELTTNTRDAGFTAEVTIETAYTSRQTYTVSGTVGDHSFTDYQSDGNATCTEDGTKTAVCDHEGCSEKDTVTDNGTKLDHSFTNYKSDGNATCTADGTKTAKCDRCDETDTVKEAAHGHKLTKVEGKAATCTEEGIIEHYNCSVCKKNFADAEGKTEKSDVTIAAGHTISKVDGKAPTETENGLKEHYGCASCGKVYADAEGKNEVTKDSLVISATGAPVDTGDDFSLVPVLVLMALSATGMALLVIKRKEF
jgi:rubredoxin